MFGKLVNGALYLAPKILMVNGEKVVYPSEDLLRSLEYKEVIYTEVPNMREGYHVIAGWAEQDGKLVQKWNYESDEEWPTSDPYLMEQLRMINEKLNQLTFDLKKVSDNVIEVVKKDDSEFESGDYLNPLPYIHGIVVKAGLFYTDGDDIWEAKKTGTPVNFEDEEYFIIIK